MINPNNYKELHAVNDVDNAFLKYYSKAWCNDENTKADDDKHEYIGYKYTESEHWFYEFDRDTDRYYVAVDKEI